MNQCLLCRKFKISNNSIGSIFLRQALSLTFSLTHYPFHHSYLLTIHSIVLSYSQSTQSFSVTLHYPLHPSQLLCTVRSILLSYSALSTPCLTLHSILPNYLLSTQSFLITHYPLHSSQLLTINPSDPHYQLNPYQLFTIHSILLCYSLSTSSNSQLLTVHPF